MIDWEKLRVFHIVAQAGSFTRAGEILGLSQSAVSRQISAIEKGLNVSLFHRHARGLILSEQGDILYKAAQEVFTRLTAVENMIGESRERPRGPLKITTTVAFGTGWLMAHMQEFMGLYPEIHPILIFEDRELDLTMREADAAIRLYPPRQPDLIQRHLMSITTGIYASNAYLTTVGIPEKIEDLNEHRLIAFGDASRPPYANIDWLLSASATRQPARRQAILRVNNLSGMLQAVETGMGIAALPNYMVQHSPHVTRILDDVSGPKTDAYLVYTSELRHSKRIKVFRDFMIQKIRTSNF